MSSIANKKIIVAVTGGIAAYKTPELVRRLKDLGADVRVVMTKGAKEFITPLTLQAVSGHMVADSLLDPAAEAAMGHIELAKWADLILIAPTTADIIAKLTVGMADDLLTTLCLATAADIVVVPAMNQQMWRAAATQYNIKVLKERGVHIWGPASGVQACGDVGLGRMLEPAEITELCLQFFNPASKALFLAGQHWVITAGPTREAIDPVRYISNHSSGKMGYAIASAAIAAGAKVSLISGPVTIQAPQGCTVIQVESAQQMHKHALELAKSAQVFVACAAVADFRMADVAPEKLKKVTTQDTMSLTLVKNPDIVADVAAMAKKPFTVGFAAETQQVESYAKTKLIKKNLDMIAANDVSNVDQGFNSDDNALSVFWQDGSEIMAKNTKIELAKQLIKLIHTRYQHGPH